MKLGLGIKTALTQTLTPQQIQYLKLLQLPVMQLEAQVKQEIEMNPMLEEDGSELELVELQEYSEYKKDDEEIQDEYSNVQINENGVIDSNDYQTQALYMDDKSEPFEYQKMVMDADPVSNYDPNRSSDDDDYEPFQIKENADLASELLNQLRMLNLSEEENLLAENIIGNIDEDGYLRRDEIEILGEVNKTIAEINFRNYQEHSKLSSDKVVIEGKKFHNPAKLFEISKQSRELLKSSQDTLSDTSINEKGQVVHNDNGVALKRLRDVVKADFDRIHSYILKLEPAGIGSRNIQECLLAQLKAISKKNAAQKLSEEIIENYYEAFSKKHYHVITKQLEIGEDYLKEALEEIRRLNPKPGGIDYQNELNTIIPDFMISRNNDNGEIMISINDKRIPELKLSKAYENMKKDAEFRKYNKETKDWIRSKREDAKFLIQALRQRKATMLKVMTAIAHIQEEFFDFGPSGLKPLIYKNIAEETGLDISTVCRIVNGKYVQTAFGTFELKYFFSESLPSDDGEDVSTKVIKDALKKIIDEEDKNKPFSDDKLSKELKNLGYNVARRTVAKYREQMNISVARLRKELI